MAKELQDFGVKTIIYTDIKRDGMLTGPNVKAIREIVEAVDIPVIASGGISRIEDIRKLYKMKNIDQSNDHFMMEPKEQFAVVKDIRTAGLEMLAIYHSHPETPARPSAEDIKLALTPDVIYVIVSLQATNASAIRGFLIKDGNIENVPVRILKE